MTGGIEAGKAYVKFLLEDGQLKASLAKVGTKLQAIGKVGAAVTGPVLGLFAASALAASDAAETMSKFNVVFGDQAGAVKAWGDQLAKSVGRSKYEIAGALASFQDLLVPMGMVPGEARDMSKELVALSIDLASFNNMNDADVARDLAAALTGSGEVMKKYGVIVSEAAVKQELLNMNLDPKAATEAEKAQARLNIIMRGTTAAQGDAARTADGFANQMKALRSSVYDAAVELGNALLPTLQELAGKALAIVGHVTTWIEKNPELTKQMALVTAGVAAASLAVFGLGTALTFITLHPIIAFLALVAGAIAYVTLAFDNWHNRILAILKLLGPVTFAVAKLIEQAEKMGFKILPDSLSEKSSVVAAVENFVPPEIQAIKTDAAKLQAEAQASLANATAATVGGSMPAGAAKMAGDLLSKAAVDGIEKLVGIQEKALQLLQRGQGGFRVGTG